MKKEEIIKCRDCKYFEALRTDEEAKKCGQIYECKRGVFMSPRENDYCSRAKKGINNINYSKSEVENERPKEKYVPDNNVGKYGGKWIPISVEVLIEEGHL